MAPQQYGKVLSSTKPFFGDFTESFQQNKPDVKEFDYGGRAAAEKKKAADAKRRFKTMRWVVSKRTNRFKQIDSNLYNTLTTVLSLFALGTHPQVMPNGWSLRSKRNVWKS